jgi:hypothetical protein
MDTSRRESGQAEEGKNRQTNRRPRRQQKGDHPGSLRRKEGATLAEIANATGWQNHSIHGFMSGHLRKKMGLTVESEKNEKGKRTYRIG